jgi:5,10-methylenetetrahydromethanopterin reductase
VAHELGDGVFATGPVTGFDRCAILQFGTVLDDGEDPGSPRSLAAAGHAGALVAHGMHVRGIDVGAVIAGGRAWVEALEAFPEDERHLAVHEGHLIDANERDRATILTGELLARFGYARDAAGWRQRLDELESGGATEVAYQPAGPDIPGELARFAAMMRT